MTNHSPSQADLNQSPSRESEAKYRGLMEAAPDAMVVVDQSWKIILLNVQAEKQFGYPRNELLGQNPNLRTLPRTDRLTVPCTDYFDAGVNSRECTLLDSGERNGTMTVVLMCGT